MPLTKITAKQINYNQGNASSVTRIASDKLKETVSILDFGAHSTTEAGYSSFDSTEAFQTALDNNNRVLVPSGIYRTTAPIVMQRYGQELIGVNGTYQSQILADHLLGPVINIINGAAKVENLFVDASASRRAGADNTLNCGILIGKIPTSSSISALPLAYQANLHASYSSTAGNFTSCLVQRTIVNRQPGAGVVMAGGGANTRFEQVSANYCKSYGFLFDDGSYLARAVALLDRAGIITLDDCRAVECGGAGLNLSAHFSGTSFRIIINNMELFDNAWNTTLAAYDDAQAVLRGQNIIFNGCGFSDNRYAATTMADGGPRTAKSNYGDGVRVLGLSSQIEFNNCRYLQLSRDGYIEGVVESPTLGVYVRDGYSAPVPVKSVGWEVTSYVSGVDITLSDRSNYITPVHSASSGVVTVAGIKSERPGAISLPSDAAAFIAACASGGKISIPAGTYNLTLTAGIALGANTKLEGAGIGATILNIVPSSTAYMNLFSLSDYTSIKGLTINWTPPVGSSGMSLFSFGNGSNILVDSISANLGVTQTGYVQGSVAGVQNAPNHLFAINGNASNVVIRNSHFKNFKFGILKTSVATFINTEWSFLNNIFENYYAPAVTFNTPSGKWDNCKVIGNTFKNSLAYTISSYEHAGGIAGGLDSGRFIFSENIFVGSGEGLHFEEGATEVIVSNNVFSMSDCPIYFIDNNVGGVWRTPTKFIIDGNTLTRSGSSTSIGGDLCGIYIVPTIAAGTSGTVSSAKHMIISNNIISGFDAGIITDDGAPYVIISDNYIIDCTVGIQGIIANANIQGNTFTNCATGVSATSRGGLIGANTFIACTKPLDDTTNTYFAAMSGWEIVYPALTLPGSTVSTVVVLPIGYRIEGEATLVLQCSLAYARRLGVVTLSYDGTTLTATPKVTAGAGNVLTPSFVKVGNDLCLSIHNGDPTANIVSLKVSFRGTYAEN